MNRQIVAKHLLFSIIIVGAFLFSVELLARGLYVLVPSLDTSSTSSQGDRLFISDPILNHRWRPSLNVELHAHGIKTILYTNDQSWVEKYSIAKEKPKDTYRIFYVGDSNVQGVVRWEKTMVELVEHELNQIYEPSGKTIEVINTGTSSYSPLLYYLLIKEKILNYSPDLVIINVDMTDVTNDRFYRMRLINDWNGTPLAVSPFQQSETQQYLMTPEGILELSLLDQWNKWFYEHLAFYRFLSIWLIDRSAQNLRPAKTWVPWQATLDASANWLAHQRTEAITRNIEFSMGILGKTIRLLKDRKVSVALTGVPHFPQYTQQWSATPHEELAQTAQQYQCPYLNSYEVLKPAIQGTPVTEYYWADDPTHFNENGNRIWAEAQVEFLLKNREKLLPNLPQS